MEQYIRRLVSGQEIRPRPPDEYAGLLRELSAIGNNVNQIARLANAQKEISPDQVQEAVRLVREAWRMTKDAF